MPERSNGAVSKTVECASAPGVRIPLSPPDIIRTKQNGFTSLSVQGDGGDVAQLGEHLVRNEGVGGSSPLISTMFVFQEVVLDGEVAVPCTCNPL